MDFETGLQKAFVKLGQIPKLSDVCSTLRRPFIKKLKVKVFLKVKKEEENKLKQFN